MARVLVAEDDPDLRGMIEFKLASAGHEVTVVADGDAAMTSARAAPPDLAVLDVMMPGMSGIEVCEALRADPVTAATPIIMLTARAQSADVSRGLAAGADEYLVKPFSPRSLVEHVEKLLAAAAS
ncbi:response regulator transcription factor [Actinophytocola xanthii]|uniref:Response regulator n=1 Tax=Actinophytocola xanthii TaxID=1912961 RepID=A0A1Q8C2J5_9PSEU|nr:response regulator [Actinophytocola xanthii]OLF08585.1 response regulator [Actinophytocola xanthii]